MAETPLRKNELGVIALLSGMIRQYNEIDSNTPLDDMHKLICKTAIEILDVCESKTVDTSENTLPIQNVVGQSELLKCFVPEDAATCHNPNKNSECIKCRHY